MSTPTTQITGWDRGPMWWQQNPDDPTTGGGYYPPEGNPQAHTWGDGGYGQRRNFQYPQGPPVIGQPMAWGSSDPTTGQPPTATGVTPAAGTTPAAASGTSPFDLSGLLSGTILGIPTLYVIGGVLIYFFFIKKGR